MFILFEPATYISEVGLMSLVDIVEGKLMFIMTTSKPVNKEDAKTLGDRLNIPVILQGRP